MAGIDKIYGTDKQYEEFYGWAKENRPEILKYFYPREGGSGPITNLPEKEDMWLLKNCPIKFVVDRIKEQYAFTCPQCGREHCDGYCWTPNT